MRQPNLFDSSPEDDDLFGEERPPLQYRADPEKVRAELLAILARAKGAATMLWSHEDLRYHQTVFPQMSRWLPEDEAAQMCFEFNEELKRLKAA